MSPDQAGTEPVPAARERRVAGVSDTRSRPRKPSVTMAEVAARAGVSRALVSLVVRESPLVSEPKRQAVLRAIEELGYRHNQIASRLAAKSTRTIGLQLLDLHNTVYAQLHDGLAPVVAGAGFQLLLVAGSPDPGREHAAIDSLVKLRVDGLLLAGFTGDAEQLHRLAGGTPVVVINRPFRAAGVDAVYGDDGLGAERAVDHLVALGHERIAHIASPERIPYPHRRQGYLRAMARHGLPELLLEAEMTEAGGWDAVQVLWSQPEPPSAILAHNDVAAAGAVSALQARGVPVPGEVSVVGYDNTRLSAVAHGGLTTVDLHAHEQGAVAGRLLLERLAEPDREPRARVVEPTLVERGSTARRS